MAESHELWNINIHYDRLLAGRVAPGWRVLDAGCGDGFLAARLGAAGCRVVALDADRAVLERARRRWAGREIEWVHADLLDHSLPSASFDAVLSNAAIHHVPDMREALGVMTDLVKPGGVLAVVGFARNGPLDWPMSLLGAVGILVMNRRHHKWEHTAPIVWPPPLTYGQVRRVCAEALPGCRFRRLWLGRYVVEWTCPERA